MNVGAILDYSNTALQLANQGANLYSTFSNKSTGTEGNSNVNENHYHITKSPEEIAIEKKRLELQEQQNQFNRATYRAQHAENIRERRKIIDEITGKNKPDNTALYILSGIIVLGVIFSVIKK